MESPSKAAKKAPIQLIDNTRQEESPDTVGTEGPAEEDIKVLRQKSVGEVDLPESTRHSFMMRFHALLMLFLF
jgi:hypothetical protein